MVIGIGAVVIIDRILIRVLPVDSLDEHAVEFAAIEGGDPELRGIVAEHKFGPHIVSSAHGFVAEPQLGNLFETVGPTIVSDNVFELDEECYQRTQLLLVFCLYFHIHIKCYTLNNAIIHLVP